MRINEYRSIDEFKSQYIGVWAPSDGHWLGLDFAYKGEEFRLHTGSMYNMTDTILTDGRTAIFGIYLKCNKQGFEDSGKGKKYLLLGEFADMCDLLESRVIDNRPFKEVIMDDMTELLGQD